MILLALALLAATPATFPAQLAIAQPGDRIVLAPADYGNVGLRDRVYPVPLVIDAGAARLHLEVDNVTGLAITGGDFTASAGVDLATSNGPDGWGARVSGSHNVSFANPMFSGAVRGLMIDRSTDVAVTDATLVRIVSDGIDVANSQRVAVTGSICSQFSPRDGDHPDCVQLWSSPGALPTADVKIRDNIAVGPGMEGFSGFNHPDIGQLGFDRITITGNLVVGDYPEGVALYDARNSRVIGNRVWTLPGAKFRTRVNVERCKPRCSVRGNKEGAQ